MNNNDFGVEKNSNKSSRKILKGLTQKPAKNDEVMMDDLKRVIKVFFKKDGKRKKLISMIKARENESDDCERDPLLFEGLIYSDKIFNDSFAEKKMLHGQIEWSVPDGKNEYGKKGGIWLDFGNVETSKDIHDNEGILKSDLNIPKISDLNIPKIKEIFPHLHSQSQENFEKCYSHRLDLDYPNTLFLIENKNKHCFFILMPYDVNCK